MSRNTLDNFIAQIRASWGPLTTQLAASCRQQLGQLLQASPAEPWLASLRNDRPASRELYRDAEHGFVLLAHTETDGLYRQPHDHGRAWVLYGVQAGEIEMGGYGRLDGPDGRTQLVKRDATVVRAGCVMTYLPGDIHDTRCVQGPALLFRFIERDLSQENRDQGAMTRFVERDGTWVADKP